MPLVAAAVAGVAAWCSIGAIGLTGPSTANRVALAAPLWLLVALPLAAAVLAWAARLTPRMALPLFFSIILILPWVPGRIPAAFLIWTGPVTLIVWLAIGVSLIAVHRVNLRSLTEPARASRLAAVLACVLFVASAWLMSDLMPTGDEPHYLVITQSLLMDRDLQIENNHARGDYLHYFPGQLKPDYLRRGLNGRIYSIHSPGLPALLAPVYGWFGYPGVVFFLCLLATAGSLLLWRACYALTSSAAAAWFGWAGGTLSAPFFLHAFAVYPDAVGATLLMFAAGPLVRDGPISERRWMAIGAALAFLPWLHARFAVIAVAAGLCLLLRLIAPAGLQPGTTGVISVVPAFRRARSAAVFLIIPLISAAGWFSYFRMIWGTFSPTAPYGDYTQSALANIPTGLSGLIVDQQFGVMANAPIYGFCLVGLAAMGRRRPRLALEIAFIACVYLLVAASYYVWWGGRSAPARFAVPMLPLLVAPGAWLWQNTRSTATRAIGMVALFLTLVQTAVMAVARGGRLAFNDRDGVSLALEWWSPLVNLPRGFPSLFQATWSDALLQTLPITLGVLGAWGVLRALEQRSSPAGNRIAAPASLAIAGMLAVSALWRWNDVAGVTPLSSRQDLLRHYDERIRPFAFVWSTYRATSPAQLLPQLSIVTALRRPPAPGAPLLVVPDLPAGRYRLMLTDRARASGTATLLIGRTSQPIRTWNLERQLSGPDAEFDLPVDVGAVLISGDADATRTARQLAMQALMVRPRNARVASSSALRAAKYGNFYAYFLDDRGYMEPAGFWVAGDATSEVVAQTAHTVSSLKVFVRNAPVPNTLHIEAGDWKTDLDLGPRQEQIVDVPLPSGASAVRLLFRTDAGFIPALVEEGSSDYRNLGVWVEFR